MHTFLCKVLDHISLKMFMSRLLAWMSSVFSLIKCNTDTDISRGFFSKISNLSRSVRIVEKQI